MHAINLSDKSIKISSKIRFEFLTDFDETEVYLAESEAAELAHVDQDNLSYFNQNNLWLVNFTHSEIILLSSITVYSNKQIIKILSKIINYYDIWMNYEDFTEVLKKK